jgi:hypothetical protein
VVGLAAGAAVGWAAGADWQAVLSMMNALNMSETLGFSFIRVTLFM